MTTDASGNYSVTVKANETITGNFYVSKGTEYDFSVYNGLNLTPVSDLSYDIPIYPVNTSTYTKHIVSGLVYQSDGTTQIADGSNVYIKIINENGGSSGISITYVTDTGYSIETTTFGTDCVLFISVDDLDYNPVFNYYIDNIDLSASTVSLDLTQPSSGYSTVAITGVDGDTFEGFMLYSDSIYLNPVYGSISGSNPTDVEIYNPDNKSFFWSVSFFQTDTPASGDETMNVVVSTASVPGTAVTLPVPSLATPTEAVQGSSVNYSASTGTLSFTGSADLYEIELCPDGDEDFMCGYIISSTSSVDLPADIVAIITSGADSYTSWDASVYPASISNFNMDIFLAFQSYYSIISNIEYVEIEGAASESVDLIP